MLYKFEPEAGEALSHVAENARQKWRVWFLRRHALDRRRVPLRVFDCALRQLAEFGRNVRSWKLINKLEKIKSNLDKVPEDVQMELWAKQRPSLFHLLLCRIRNLCCWASTRRNSRPFLSFCSSLFCWLGLSSHVSAKSNYNCQIVAFAVFQTTVSRVRADCRIQLFGSFLADPCRLSWDRFASKFALRRFKLLKFIKM